MLATLAGCGQSSPDGGSAATSETSDVASPPGIDPTAAPGVAFRYDSAFRLPDERISKVQEAHAAACEALGPARCRITGMNYTVDEQDAVQGRLEIKLAPAIARDFGKSALASVVRDDGRLISTEFTGEDVATGMATAGDTRVVAAAELTRIEGQLARSDLKDEERATLRGRADELRRTVESARQSVQTGTAQLAVTPMVLRYYGAGGVPGFTENPVRAAWALFVGSGVTLVGFVLKAIAVVLPWAVLLALLLALWWSAPIRSARQWVRHRRIAHTEPLP